MNTKLALHFGAGKIGKGFIGELLHDSGYKIIFVDVIDNLVDQINKDEEYNLYLLEHDHQLKVIDNVIAYSSIKNPEKVIKAIKGAEIITTSVIVTNLDKVAPLLAKGLIERTDKVIIMACENAILGTNILKQALLDTNIITKEHLDKIAIFTNTAVDRIVFDYKDGVEIADAYELAIEDVLPCHPKKILFVIKIMLLYIFTSWKDKHEWKAL